MIIRRLAEQDAAEAEQPQVRAAFAVFLESQKSATPPFGVVLQIAHSELAGELAKALLPEAFGDLPPEAIEAAWKHDFGWEASDAAQTGRMPDNAPRPFPEVPDDELPSWRESLRLAEAHPPLTRALIGRHFEALANQPSPRHEEFCRVDVPRLRELESTLGASEQDLNRWAGAVGFSDLLSLVLCAGVTESTEFPLAHPASKRAETARKVVLTWENGQPRFSEPVFRPGTEFRIEGQQLGTAQGDVRPMALRWTFQ